MEDGVRHLSQLPQRPDSEEVRGHQEREDAGVIGRTEARGNETDGLDRVADAVDQTIGWVESAALEAVRPRPIFALLHAHGLENLAHRFFPRRVERTRIAGLL